MATVNVPPVTPVGGTNSVVTSGGSAVQAAPGQINGGYITNPASEVDQNVNPPEDLLIDQVSNSSTLASLLGYGTTIRLPPGGSISLIPGTTLPTFANATTSGHRFTVVVY